MLLVDRLKREKKRKIYKNKSEIINFSKDNLLI